MEKEEIFEVRCQRERGWYFIDNEFLDIYAKHVGIYASGVYNSLCRYANKDQKSWPSIKKITEELNISKTSVIDSIKKLEFFGIIKKIRVGKKCTNRYFLAKKSEWKSISEVRHTNFTNPVSEVRHTNFTSPPHGLHKSATRTSIVRRPKRKKTNSKASKSKDLQKRLLYLLDDSPPLGEDSSPNSFQENFNPPVSGNNPDSTFSGIEPKEKNSAKREIPRKDTDIIAVIDGSADWNPAMFKSWYGNTTQRKAITKLLLLPEIDGLNGLLAIISILPKLCSQPYAPKVTSPWELLNNWARIKMFIGQQKMLQKKGGVGKVGNLQEFLDNN